MRDLSKMTKGKLISYYCHARGTAWREVFQTTNAATGDRYFAAVKAESIHGPHNFQREVCALAITSGKVHAGNYHPPARGRHARRSV